MKAGAMRPYRKEKLASVVRQVVSEAVVHKLSDPRISPLTTVTRVVMSPDLQIAKVYLSVQGGEAVERRTLRALRHAAGYLQRMVAGALQIRQCPELRIDLDQGVKEARKTMDLLAQHSLEEPDMFNEQSSADAEPLDPEELEE